MLDVSMFPPVVLGVLMVLDRGARVLLLAASWMLGDRYVDCVFLDSRGMDVDAAVVCSS